MQRMYALDKNWLNSFPTLESIEKLHFSPEHKKQDQKADTGSQICEQQTSNAFLAFKRERIRVLIKARVIAEISVFQHSMPFNSFLLKMTIAHVKKRSISYK